MSATTRSLLKLDQAYYRRLGGRDHSALIGEPDKNGTIRFENLPNELRQVHADALCPVSPKGAVPFVHVNLMCKSGMASNRHSFTSIPKRNLHTMKFRFTAALKAVWKGSHVGLCHFRGCSKSCWQLFVSWLMPLPNISHNHQSHRRLLLRAYYHLLCRPGHR